MNERDFLAAYDPSAFPAMAVTADVVVLAVRDGALCVLLARRAEHPAKGRLALPGVFVGLDEELDEAAARAVRAKAGVDVPVRQFRAFGAVRRDPRMRIVSVGYLAVALAGDLAPVLDDDHLLLPLDEVGGGDGDDVRDETGERLALPFDHADIAAAALAYLRADLDRSAFPFGLLPDTFTLRELQQVHEAVRGERLNKPAFRKRLLDSGKLVGTGVRDAGGRYRPAELYRVRAEAFA